MNREQMLEGLANGVSPLELSITKWEEIRSREGTDLGGNNCALCEVYNTIHPYELCKNHRMEVCPIRLAQPDSKDRCCIQYDAYEATVKLCSDGDPLIIEALDAMIDFLKSLRPKKGVC